MQIDEQNLVTKLYFNIFKHILIYEISCKRKHQKTKLKLLILHKTISIKVCNFKLNSVSKMKNMSIDLVKNEETIVIMYR